MIKYFDYLNEDEIEMMFRTPLFVAILIAGADDKFDKKEIREAVNISKFKQSKSRELLKDYYKIIGEDFEGKLMEEIDSLPSKARKRNPIIIEELEKLNKILPKLNRTFALQFYESIKDIAKKIVTASGGILGYITIHYQEQKLIDLKMIKEPSKFNK